MKQIRVVILKPSPDECTVVQSGSVGKNRQQQRTLATFYGPDRAKMADTFASAWLRRLEAEGADLAPIEWQRDGGIDDD